MAVKTKKVGRPTEYDEDLHPRLAYAACSEGIYTQRRLVKILGISRPTLRAWKNDHPEFLSQMLRGMDEYSLEEGEHSLRKLVKGGRFTERTSELQPVYEDVEGSDEFGAKTIKTLTGYEMVVVKKVSKVRAPNQKSVEYLLNNLSKNGRWKSQTSLKIGGDGDGDPILFQDIKNRKDLMDAGDELLKQIAAGGAKDE